MKKFMIFAVIAALLMAFSLTAFAQSDILGDNDYEAETKGDDIEEIKNETPEEDGELPEDQSDGYNLALTVIFSAIGVIAAGGITAAVFIFVKSKKIKQ